jgi:DNA adenine methylase
VYAHDSAGVAAEVRAWCAANGNDPDYRIVLAGYDTEHQELEALGWRVVEWYRTGFLRGGMANVGGAGKSQQGRERLWLSPHCVKPSAAATTAGQRDLFGGE